MADRSSCQGRGQAESRPSIANEIDHVPSHPIHCHSVPFLIVAAPHTRHMVCLLGRHKTREHCSLPIALCNFMNQRRSLSSMAHARACPRQTCAAYQCTSGSSDCRSSSPPPWTQTSIIESCPLWVPRLPHLAFRRSAPRAERVCVRSKIRLENTLPCGQGDNLPFEEIINVVVGHAVDLFIRTKGQVRFEIRNRHH